jgi:hypothetical protein
MWIFIDVLIFLYMLFWPEGAIIFGVGCLIVVGLIKWLEKK